MKLRELVYNMVSLVNNRHEWRRLKKLFENTEYGHWQPYYISEISGEPTMNKDDLEDFRRPNKWNTPITLLNPEILNLILNLNDRLEKIEDKLRELRK